MKLTVPSLLFGLALLVTLSASKADPDDTEASVDQGDSDVAEDDKRSRIMRYGRGSVFRYGKRDGDDEYDAAKRIFRYGKRDEEYKRLFRYGKRDYDLDDEDMMDEDKRIFRYGKRADEEEKRRVFRYGKRDPVYEKRPIFRYGKRADLDELLEEAKRRIMRYGREARAPQDPHVPFRFGEEE